MTWTYNGYEADTLEELCRILQSETAKIARLEFLLANDFEAVRDTARALLGDGWDDSVETLVDVARLLVGPDE